MCIIKAVLVVVILICSCKTHAIKTSPDLARKDLDPIIRQKTASQRLQHLISTTICYRYIIDGKPLPRCLCIHGNEDLTTTSEMSCAYPTLMQIPLFPIEVTTEP